MTDRRADKPIVKDNRPLTSTVSDRDEQEDTRSKKTKRANSGFLEQVSFPLVFHIGRVPWFRFNSRYPSLRLCLRDAATIMAGGGRKSTALRCAFARTGAGHGSPGLRDGAGDEVIVNPVNTLSRRRIAARQPMSRGPKARAARPALPPFIVTWSLWQSIETRASKSPATRF